MTYKKQITGLNTLYSCPDWVQYLWTLTLSGISDREEYDEENDLQIFVFNTEKDINHVFEDLKNIKFVKIWELPEGDIRYEAYTQ